MSTGARQFVRALKEERPIGIPPQSPSSYAARRLSEELSSSLLRDFFSSGPLLVPVPRSSLSVEGGIWPALNIAAALVERGIGAAVLPCLSRSSAVRKSAFAVAGARPRPAEHYDSIQCRSMVSDRSSLCLVDDVITKGATLLAAATRLQDAFPQANVSAFALVRTLGFVEDIEKMMDPAVGTITLRGDEAHREP